MMLPQHLIEEFWLTVKSLAQKKHGLSAAAAEKWTVEFRKLAARRMGDMIYHDEPEAVARTVAGGAKRGGFPEPESTVA